MDSISNNTFRKFLITATLLSTVSLLYGCSNSPSKSDKLEESVVQKVNNADFKTSNFLEKNKVNEEKNRNFIHWKDTPVLNIEKTVINKRLPNIFDKTISIDEFFLVDVKDMTLKVSKLLGLEIKILPEVFGVNSVTKSSMTGGSEGGSGLSIMDGAGNSSTNTDGGNSLMGGSSFGGANSGQSIEITLNYSGKAKGLIDVLASKLDAHWRYDDESERVVFYKYKTKIFSIPSLPGESSVDANVDDSISSSTRSAGFAVKTNVWISIREDISKMVPSNDGEYFTLSESSGLLTVKTTPQRMKSVEKYIENVKKNMRSQIFIDVKIYSINIEDSLNREVNFESLLSTAGFGLNFSSGANSTSLAGATSFILSPKRDQMIPQNEIGGLTLGQDSQSLLNVLNKLGRTSVVSTVPIRTINNQPGAISKTTIESYLESTEITTDPQTGVQSSSLTTKEIKTGLSVNVLPSLDENGRNLMLQIAFSLSDVIRYDNYKTVDGSESITPVINSRDFVEKVWLESGQTLMLTGFDYNKSIDVTSGPFSPSNWFAGGSKEKSLIREKLVILITPKVYNTVNSNKLY